MTSVSTGVVELLAKVSVGGSKLKAVVVIATVYSNLVPFTGTAISLVAFPSL
jgi:hypothetical protein